MKQLRPRVAHSRGIRNGWREHVENRERETVAGRVMVRIARSIFGEEVFHTQMRGLTSYIFVSPESLV